MGAVVDNSNENGSNVPLVIEKAKSMLGIIWKRTEDEMVSITIILLHS